MIFEKYLLPDKIIDKFEDVTADMLKEDGINCVISDIDNTLATYDESEPNDSVKIWAGSLKKNGIRLILVSNNTEERVRKFVSGLDCDDSFYDVRKPSVKYYLKALDRYHIKKEEALVLGDQLLTDAWSARRCGIRVYIVPPIKDKKSLFFRFKRAIERPYIRKYYKTHRGKQ